MPVHSDMPHAPLTLPALLYNEVKVCWLEYCLDQPHKTQGVVSACYSVRVGVSLQQTSQGERALPSALCHLKPL